MLTGTLGGAVCRGGASARRDGAGEALRRLRRRRRCTIVDGQTLREVYLAPFKAVVDAGVASLMFLQPHQWQSIRAATRQRSRHILRGEYGFRGFVTSDWGATHGAEFITRGLDMEQPGTGPGVLCARTEEPEEQGMSTAGGR